MCVGGQYIYIDREREISIGDREIGNHKQENSS